MCKFSRESQRSYPFRVNNVWNWFGNATMKESRGRKIQRDSSRGWRMKRYFPFISGEGNEAIKSPWEGGDVFTDPPGKRGENLRPLFHLAWPFSIPAQQSSRSENNSDFSFVNGPSDPRTFDTRYTPLMTGLAYLIDDAAEKSIQSALRCLLYTNLSCIPVSCVWYREIDTDSR